MVVFPKKAGGSSHLSIRVLFGNRIQWCVVVSMLLLSMSRAVLADEPATLALTIVPSGNSSSVRSTSPASLTCKLEYSSQRLLEGHLRLELYDRKERVGVVRVDDLVLSGGDYEFDMMLPPFKAPSTKFVEIRATFVAENREISLEAVNLVASNDQQRGMVAMFVVDDPTDKNSTAQKGLKSVLDPNRFNPYRTANLEYDLLYFYPARYEVGDVPISPLRYCSVDLVVVCEETLGKLREKQLNAMALWVQAGGVACIVADGRLSAEHLSFLNEVSGVSTREGLSPFIAKSDGLIDRDFGEQGYESYSYGLGRVAIISPTLELEKLTDIEIGPLNAFAWRMRSRNSEVLSGQSWLTNTQSGYRQQKIPAIGKLVRRAMPADVRIIPFGVVGSLLVLYVLAIGPGDYCLLGLMKLRKLTWIVFPLVTLAFTMFTIWMSHHYMGSGAPGKPVVFIDIVQGNTVARTSEFSLIFSGSQQQVVQEIDNAIATAINQHDFAFSNDPTVNNRPTTGNITSFSGRFPTRYRMVQSVEQWSPQLNRVFRIAPDVKLPKFDWDAEPPTTAEALTSSVYMTALEKRITDAFGSDASAFLFAGDQIKHFKHGRIGTLFDDEQYDQLDYRFSMADYLPSGQRRRINVLHEACVRSPVQWFDTVSQVSPTGADNFEDLTLLDASDPNQVLLVVITEGDDGYKIYRRLYDSGNAMALALEKSSDESLDKASGN